MRSFCAHDDERMFFKAIRGNLHGKRVLEVGSGIGAFASLLFYSGIISSYVGAELAEDRIEAARADEFLTSNRAKFLHVDGFLLDWSEFDVVVANPPMIPGELGFTTEGEIFWERIGKKYSSESYSGIFYMHVFDFYINSYRSAYSAQTDHRFRSIVTTHSGGL